MTRPNGVTPQMSLTDTFLRNLKPQPKATKSFDGKGLYVEVTARGSKRWRLKYRFGGREKLLSLGLYPDVSLKAARERCYGRVALKAARAAFKDNNTLGKLE